MKDYPLYRFLIRHLENIRNIDNDEIIKKIINDEKELKRLGKEWVKNIDIKNENFIDIDEFLAERVKRYEKC